MTLSHVVLCWVGLGSQRHVINSRDTTQMAATKKLTWAQLQVRDQSVAKVCVSDHRSWTRGASWKMNGKHCVFFAASDCVNAKEVGGEEGVAQREWQNTLNRCALKQLPLFTISLLPSCQEGRESDLRYWCKVQHTAIVPFLCNCSWGFYALSVASWLHSPVTNFCLLLSDCLTL